MSGPERSIAESRPPSAGRSGGSRDPRVWTVLELLRWTTEHFAGCGIEGARLDAECLLAHALGVARLQLYLDFDKPVSEAERTGFRELVRRRAGERIPVALLIGEKEFWSMPLRVTPDVLVPRPETETLVSAALELIPDPEAAVRVLELGTGSGAVALAIAKERPASVITATDISAPALKIAQENAERHGMAERIQLLEGDLWAPLGESRFDLIVSNPPYVAESERADLAPELDHEPEPALFAGADGRDVLERLVDGVSRWLAPGGVVALEHGAEQGDWLMARSAAAGLTRVTTHRDLAGRARVVTARGADVRGG